MTKPKQQRGLSRPPKPETTTMDRKLEAFVSGAEGYELSPAEVDQSGQSKAEVRPWESARSDVKKQLLVWLPEETKEKLKWVAERTPHSQQQIARDAIQEAVNREVERLLKG